MNIGDKVRVRTPRFWSGDSAGWSNKNWINSGASAGQEFYIEGPHDHDGNFHFEGGQYIIHKSELEVVDESSVNESKGRRVLTRNELIDVTDIMHSLAHAGAGAFTLVGKVQVVDGVGNVIGTVIRDSAEASWTFE